MDFMDDLAKPVSILLVLLPGFVSAKIITALAFQEKRDALDRVVLALIFTLVNYVTWLTMVSLVRVLPFVDSARPWSETTNLLGLLSCSVVWGVIGVWIINSDKLHLRLRKWRLTKRGSRPSVWYDVFWRSENVVYVVVRMKDGKRAYGWPRLYSEDPDAGHLFLSPAKWLKPKGKVWMQGLLLNVSDVYTVEFCKPQKTGATDDGTTH